MACLPEFYLLPVLMVLVMPVMFGWVITPPWRIPHIIAPSVWDSSNKQRYMVPKLTW